MAIRISFNRCRDCGLNFGTKFGLEFHPCIVAVPAKVRKALEDIWFTFGNGGPKHTHGNHRAIQCLIEGRNREARCFRSTKECKAAIAKCGVIL